MRTFLGEVMAGLVEFDLMDGLFLVHIVMLRTQSVWLRGSCVAKRLK